MIHVRELTPVAVMRMTTTTGNKKALATTQTSDCEYQNIDTRQQHVSEGVASKTYKQWYDINEDIQEGDVIRDRNSSQTYKVIGVEKKGQGMGIDIEHLEVILVKYSF
jgi:hypothetical protein